MARQGFFLAGPSSTYTQLRHWTLDKLVQTSGNIQTALPILLLIVLGRGLRMKTCQVLIRPGFEDLAGFWAGDRA